MSRSPEEPPEDTEAGATQEKPHYDVFVSYSRDQGEMARRFAALARERGLSVWIDEHDLAPGSHWRDEIQSAVRHSRSCLILLGAQVNPTDRCSALEWPEIIKNSWSRPAFDLFPVCPGTDADIPAFLRPYGCYWPQTGRFDTRSVSHAWLERFVDALAQKLKTGQEPDWHAFRWDLARADELHQRFSVIRRLCEEEAEERANE